MAVLPAATPGATRQLPSRLTINELGEVNVRQVGNHLDVDFTVRVNPDKFERWQTGVALDASESMVSAYGRALQTHSIPPEALREYDAKGWIVHQDKDGKRRTLLRPEALRDAKSRGFVKFTDNVLEPLAQAFVSHLAEKLDQDGRTHVLYWACGPDGAQLESLGDHSYLECRQMHYDGPHKHPFGSKTCLAPAVRHFLERYADAPRGLFLFLTDGRIDDMEEVLLLSESLAKEMHNGFRRPVKLVLVGVGSLVDEDQLRQLDDFDSGVGIDLWDHKLAREMRSLNDIFAELVEEEVVVAPHANIYDAGGRLVKAMPYGLTARARFTMPASSPYFDLEIGGKKLRQVVRES